MTEGKASVEQAHELATALTDADAANAAVAARLEETRRSWRRLRLTPEPT